MASWKVLIALIIVVAMTVLSASAQSGSCNRRCGDGFTSSQPCQCNPACSNFGDCCNDYQTLCESCSGKCGNSYDKTLVCQCNDRCQNYGNCCSDYSSQCTGAGPDVPAPGPSTDLTDADLLAIGDMLWSADVFRFLPSEITINPQGQTTPSSKDDKAPQRLFTYVDESRFTDPSYDLFISLLNNYNVYNGQVEPELTTHESAETDAFLDHVMSTEVMNIVENVLVSSGKVQPGAFKTTLYDLWFAFYGRSSSMNFADSSGFEHVFVGEKKSTKINGFHSWVQMYILEKNGNLDYWGYNNVANPDLMDTHFSWDGLEKQRGSMFIGTSPEFEMAAYTLCMIARPGSVCRLGMDGNIVSIQTFDVGHEPGLNVASAFPMVN